MPLAAQLARRYRNTSQSFEDLLQVANLGLVQAVDRFDPDRGLRFSSFAVPTILGELRRHFRDTGWAVRVPRAVQENVAKVRQAQGKLSARLGRTPTPAELSEATHLDHEAVLESLEAADAFQAASLDAPARATESDDAAALLSSVAVHDQRFELVEYASVVRGTMAALPERDREAIRLRFGEDLTQDEIASAAGRSPRCRCPGCSAGRSSACGPWPRPRTPRPPRRSQLPPPPRAAGPGCAAAGARPASATRRGHSAISVCVRSLDEPQPEDVLLAPGSARMVPATDSR